MTIARSPRRKKGLRRLDGAAPAALTGVAEERFVAFLRHGVAESSAEKADGERGLSAEGHAQMKHIARGLERALPRVQAVVSSPLLRAMQTALWVGKAYRARVTLSTTETLAPEADPEAFFEFLASMKEHRIVVVGHEPNLVAMVRSLLRISESQELVLQPGGCYCVRLRTDGSAVLEWLLSPKLLQKLGGLD